ncbi:MAG: FliI/YscN family ATPase [Fidelibacterota bacterium]
MIQPAQIFDNKLDQIDILEGYKKIGKVTKVIGLVIEAYLPDGTMGELCTIRTRSQREIRAEIVGFNGQRALLMPLDETVGISPGSGVQISPRPLHVPVGPALMGRVIDALGNPIDGKGPIAATEFQPVYNRPPNPMLRNNIDKPLVTGIRSIDGLLTIGKGQRVGIFAGSGVGKSVLLGMMARYADAAVNVIALIGERGREVREFIERDLGEEGLKKSVVIVATSDQAAMLRLKGSLMAMSIAEYFRDQSQDVMLLMDSLTRVAMAQREIGLAVGEPPTAKGYTPSVFAFLPRLLERAGCNERGSISGLFTVLVEGDDLDDPMSDAARAILDGHIVLSRKLASKGHYPSVDVLQSVSRLKKQVADPEQINVSMDILDLIAQYTEAEDLINIGAYSEGANPKIDEAIEKIPAINQFLRQGMDEASSFQETLDRLFQLTSGKD